jgi:hypothetical protein
MSDLLCGVDRRGVIEPGPAAVPVKLYTDTVVDGLVALQDRLCRSGARVVHPCGDKLAPATNPST